MILYDIKEYAQMQENKIICTYLSTQRSRTQANAEDSLNVTEM